MAGKRKSGPQKVIFCDIDDVLTKGTGTRKIDERAIARIKKLVDKGYKVAFVTAKAADYIQREFIPVLEKHGILKKFGSSGNCVVYGEMGAYQVMRSSVQWPRDEFVSKYKSARKALGEEIEKIASEKGLQIRRPANEKKQYMLYYKFSGESTHKKKKGLLEVYRKAIDNLNRRGVLKTPMEIHLTHSGCNTYPKGLNKGVAVTNAIHNWGLEHFIGRAYGDMPTDKRMADRPEVDFFLVTGKSKDFLRKTSLLGLRFGARDLGKRTLGYGKKRLDDAVSRGIKGGKQANKNPGKRAINLIKKKGR